MKNRCVLTFKLYTKKWQADRLARIFRCSERMYNTLVRYAIKQMQALKEDALYQKYLAQYIELLKKEKLTRNEQNYKEHLSSYLNEIVANYGLTEYNFHSYIKKMKNESYYKVLDINTAQKLASEVWQSVSDCLYGNGKKVSFKKFGDLESIEGKTNKSGIKFNKETNCLEFQKMIIPIKVRVKDEYAQEMLKLPICYCRIERKPFKNGYKYFVQLILNGKSIKIPKLGEGWTGIDQGPSTVAAVGDKDAMLVAHGVTKDKTIKDYNKEIVLYARKMENLLRMNNPQNYNEDGIIKKGKHSWVRTHNYYKWLFRLKDAYRRKTEFVQQFHNHTANEILKTGNEFVTEPMDWAALQKRSTKPTEVTDKEIVITNKQGETKTIKKYKKKKRYGKSLNNHSPGYLTKQIIEKLAMNGKKLHFVDLQTYRASQYNPETGEYQKCTLSERTKTINEKPIQRDLLSAYDLQNTKKNFKTIDAKKAKQKLSNFIKLHDECISKLVDMQNMPSCMGLKSFK